MAVLGGGWHPERMSLTTDGLALGAAFAIAVGSAVQARQAYSELDEKTPARKSAIPLLLAAIGAWFFVVAPGTSATAMNLLLNNIGLLTKVPTELTAEEIAELPSGQAAVLAPGKPTALTAEQAAELAKGNPVKLTGDQASAMIIGRVDDIKKWLGWLLGWLFILIGALAALAGAALALANDL